MSDRDDMREALADDLRPLVLAAEKDRHNTEGCACGGECFRESDLRAGALDWADYVLASDAVARIKAEAWDEGYEAGSEDEANVYPQRQPAANPYRAALDGADQ